MEVSEMVTSTKTKTRLQQYDRTCPRCGADRRMVKKMLRSDDSAGRERAAKIIEHCQSCANALYDLYRKIIGKCETCGATMEAHPRCETCGTLCGKGHQHFSGDYRGHSLCGACIRAWMYIDKAAGRETAWNEFIHPKACPLSASK